MSSMRSWSTSSACSAHTSLVEEFALAEQMPHLSLLPCVTASELSLLARSEVHNSHQMIGVFLTMARGDVYGREHCNDFYAVLRDIGLSEDTAMLAVRAVAMRTALLLGE